MALAMFMVWVVLITLILSAIMVCFYPWVYWLDKKGSIAHAYARLWAWLCIWWVPVQRIGYHRIQKKRSILYLSNHQGNFDIFVYLAYLRIQYRWLSKDSLFNIPLIGWAMTLAKNISIKRASPKDTKRALDEIGHKLNQNLNVLAFPEGTWCKPDGKLLPFKRGIFHLIKRIECPIQILVIHGSSKVLAGDSHQLKWGKIWFYVSAIIEPDQYKTLSEQELSDYIAKRMNEVRERFEEDPQSLL